MEYKEYPDHLKKPAPTRDRGLDDLEDLLGEDLLWDAASWDPEQESAVRSTEPGREPVEAAHRLLNSGRPAEPVLVYRAIQLLARHGALGGGAPGLRVWPAVSRPGSSPLRDSLQPSGTAAGPATTRTWGVQEALKSPGVRLLCITGPAGVGKTRLAIDVAIESRQKILQARIGDGLLPEPEQAVPLLTIYLRSAESGAGNRRLAMTPYDALTDLLLALGVAEHEIPATLAERRARYAAALRGRRPVILIDDALDESQILPLLPPDLGVVVVTSRRSLAGLSPYGAVNAPLAALDASGTGALVRDCFQALGAHADEAVSAAIHEWCGGMPLPVILISRWMAVTVRERQASVSETSEGQELQEQDLVASLEAARRDWQRDHGEPAAPGVLPGFPAVAAILGSLSEDQQAAVRMLGLLRLPEADLGAVCIGTNLTRERASAALRQLTKMGLLARDDSAAVWTMTSAIADYVAAWARVADQQDADACQRMLGPLIALYELRAQGLRDTQPVLCEDIAGQPSAPGQAQENAAAEWVAAEVLAAREVLATLLDAAAVATDPAQACRLATAYLAAIAHLDGRESGWRETDRLIGPVLAVARAAEDSHLRARAIERLARDAARQGNEQVNESAGEALHGPRSGPWPEADSGAAGAGDSLTPVEQAAREGVTAPPRPVLFGARV